MSARKKTITETRKQEPSTGKQKTIDSSKASKSIPAIIGLLMVTVLGIIIYSNSFDCSFHFDDGTSIIKNKSIQDGATMKSVWAYNHNRYWPYLSMALNYRLGGLEVWGYHLFNLLVHLINAFLVYWIVLLVFSTPVMKESKLSENKKLIALTAALLFVSHPLATQSVTYIVQRLASMVTLFYFLSLAMYIKGRITKNASKYFFFLVAGISALMAFTSKENSYTLPLSIMLAEFCFIQTKKISFSFKDYRIYLALALSVVLILFALSYFSLNIFAPIPPFHGNEYTLTSKNYLFTQFSVIVKYIQLLIIPIDQNLDYDYKISNSLFEIRTLFSLLLLLALLLFALFQYNKNRMISFCILWFFITLSIESSVVPIADVIFEHRTYLPSLGFVMLLSYLVFQYASKWGKAAPVLILSAICLINATLAHARNLVWKDDITLYSDIIEKAPTKARAWGSLADAYRDNGDDSSAMTDYNEAIKLSPKYSIALHNRAGIFEKMNQNDKAIADYSRAIAADSNYFKAYYNRGTINNKIGQYDNAIKDLTKALQLDSTNANVYINRGTAYISKVMYQNAIEDFSKALTIDNQSSGAYYNRGNAYMNMKKNDEAIADYTRAIAINNTIKFAYYNRGIIYNEKEEYQKAIDDYTSAIAIDARFIQAFVNRGSIYSKQKEWNKAMADFKKALQIDPNFSLAISNLKYVESQGGGK